MPAQVHHRRFGVRPMPPSLPWPPCGKADGDGTSGGGVLRKGSGDGTASGVRRAAVFASIPHTGLDGRSSADEPGRSAESRRDATSFSSTSSSPPVLGTAASARMLKETGDVISATPDRASARMIVEPEAGLVKDSVQAATSATGDVRLPSSASCLAASRGWTPSRMRVGMAEAWSMRARLRAASGESGEAARSTVQEANSRQATGETQTST